MYPSWGNYGGSQPQNYGGSGPRKQPAAGYSGPAAGFGGFEASPSDLLFSSLQEQHRQQMQQLQMLHQKQLQSVLHHGSGAASYGGGHSGGYPGAPWHSEGADAAAAAAAAAGAQQYYNQDEAAAQSSRVPPTPMPGHQQPPPQPHSTESQPVLPPELPLTKPPDSNEPPKPIEANTKDVFTPQEGKHLTLQEQQQLWYKQHLENLQKLKQEKAKQNQKDGDGSGLPPPTCQAVPPPPSEPLKNAPPPPPPKEEPPAPPPLPEEKRPEIPQDPEEAARLQQLQAAAAQWQQVQQQRAGLQYQALMQQHEKLQKILEQYQQLIQQPSDLQSMSAEMQLRHYQMQQQQFTPLFQDWARTFILWYEQFKTYPHKDQLQDYEHQWKQWEKQMNATNAHLQERIATLTAMVPYPSSQYTSGMVGQYGQYPGQDIQMHQPSLNISMQHSPAVIGPGSQGPRPTGFGPPLESHAGPPVRGGVPAGIGVQNPDPPTVQPPSFSNVRGPRPNNPRFDPPRQGFDGPPRFDQPQQRFDGPPRFDQPQQRFDGPPRFDQQQQRFDGPPRFDQPPPRFDGPPRFDQPPPRFDGPPRFDRPPPRFDGPPRFDQPPPRFDGPPRFDQPRHRFDGPPRFGQPRFGQQPRFEQPSRPPGPPPHFEHSPVALQKPPLDLQPNAQPETKPPTSMDTKNLENVSVLPQSEKGQSKSEPDDGTNAEDLTDDNLLGNDSFFVQNDPIPQTLPTNDVVENLEISMSPANSEKPETLNNKASVTTTSVEPKSTSTANPHKPDESVTNNPSVGVPKPPVITQELQTSGQKQSRPEPQMVSSGRGRGQPPVSVQIPGRGRGQRGRGAFRGPNTLPLGEQVEEMSCEYMPPEEDTGISGEHKEYHWQDPSYEEFGEESEVTPEEIWVPDEHQFPTEEQYYEEPIGGPYMGRGRPPMMRGRPPMCRGGPPMGRGGPPMGRGGPPMGRGGPPIGRGGPPMGRGGPPMGRGGPPMGRGGLPMGRGGPPMVRGGPPMGRGGPPMGRGGPPMGRGGPPMGRGGPPMGRGGPSMGRGGPSMGRGEPLDRHWEEDESLDYSEEGEPYWGERRPPMRGMRPPFPPGRGRPPRGHSGFMHQGRGHPPHPPHGPVDHESLSHAMDSDATEMDSARHPMFHGHDPQSHPMHSDMGRGRRCLPPPPPHELMDATEEPLYNDGMERELGWKPPHGRGPPLPPQEMIDRGGIRRRPVGRGMARGMWRPGPTHEEYEEAFNEDFVEDYNHGDERYNRRPPPDDFRHDAKNYDSEWDRERAPPERDYPPHIPPPERYREGQWLEERERGRPYPYEENNRGRGELRIREYGDESLHREEKPPYPPPPSEWNRLSRLPLPPDRVYPPDYDDRRPHYEERREEPLPPLPAAPVKSLTDSSVDTLHGVSGANVLALSQRQHEIILKAAQELKLIRELQEGKAPGPSSEPRPPSTDVLTELPVGLLGLEIPADVRNVLKGMSAAAQTAPAESVWDKKPSAMDYHPGLPAAPKPSVIPKTVEYGHGHEPGATVERISYGERIILRPDPVLLDRGYGKEPLGPRDPYSRDPYYDRRPDPYIDRRDYSRERELYREKPPPDYERERYDRERYAPRDRDDSNQSMVDERAPPVPPLRSGYRDREQQLRERERSGSRDRDEHYGRPGYDRPPYERVGIDRSIPERYGHSSSPFDKRSYPEDRGPPPVPNLPPPPQPPQRVEKKPEMKNIDDILKPPGRLTRPERIVIILRGLPGSGKSHVAKLIRDKEVDCGGAPPRVLVLDDYFMTEVEKVEKDPDTGKRVKAKVLEYEYEPEMEDTYRSSMLKTFKKTLDDGFFPFIILDTINDRVKHFDQFWSAAKTKGFEVYLAEITADTQTCAKRNVHSRTLKDIVKMSNNWEPSPRHMVRLDVRSLLQDAAIEEVEMEDFNPDDEPKEQKREEEEEGDLGYLPKSKWEMDTSEAKLDKLDGLGSGGKRKREGEHMAGLEDYLQLPDDYATRMSEPGKKRVRWADLEEQKDADRKRAIGFVVGQTDWEKITDETGQLAQKALNRTKYF